MNSDKAGRRSMAALKVFLFLAALVPQTSLAQSPFVKLVEVTNSDADVRRVFFGHVVARETVDLAFQVGGQVVDFPLDEGATVPLGGLVARLDQEPFELALEEARAQSDQANRTYERYQKLAGDTVSQTTLQDAETQVELARIAVRNAERALENATLYAPFNSLVAGRLVANYSTVGAGAPVVRLHDMSDLRIEINVPETLFQQAGTDPDIEMFAEFPAGSKPYPVEFREYNAETASLGQTYSITLGMEPPTDLTVLPGSSAKVTASLSTGSQRIEIPSSAVVLANDGGARAMVFTPNGANSGTVALTDIEIAATENGKVEVTAGLEVGQEIVAVGGASLNDGDEVRRFTGFKN
ncbi:efflux RND transporter periplasmic adaptor subunit [Phaeobacter sp. J2-8]|uniref:efflux RND transporter periplasmic adaptor subunit n=1 Tax=Phaeobacter sp. J2-8 TaxID=2931394 RepID=UPI001FD28928|nr:efflux RND transporter periplasmic adaptor subunit [Phaeobacter sp. J2-8]MCJ7872040.1 efflux RND transporter periplasmic adaptor subunit [Phaeobacter sp. J2-8]